MSNLIKYVRGVAFYIEDVKMIYWSVPPVSGKLNLQLDVGSGPLLIAYGPTAEVLALYDRLIADWQAYKEEGEVIR